MFFMSGLYDQLSYASSSIQLVHVNLVSVQSWIVVSAYAECPLLNKLLLQDN